MDYFFNYTKNLVKHVITKHWQLDVSEQNNNILNYKIDRGLTRNTIQSSEMLIMTKSL